MTQIREDVCLAAKALLPAILVKAAMDAVTFYAACAFFALGPLYWFPASPVFWAGSSAVMGVLLARLHRVDPCERRRVCRIMLGMGMVFGLANAVSCAVALERHGLFSTVVRTLAVVLACYLASLWLFGHVREGGAKVRLGLGPWLLFSLVHLCGSTYTSLVWVPLFFHMMEHGPVTPKLGYFELLAVYTEGFSVAHLSALAILGESVCSRREALRRSRQDFR